MRTTSRRCAASTSNNSTVIERTRAAYRPLETACGSFYVQAFESPAERYSWLDEISDPQLVERLHGLSDADLELLTQIVIDGKSYREAAKVFSYSHQNISRHIARIRKNLS